MTSPSLDLSIFTMAHLDAAASPASERVAEFVALWGIGLLPAILGCLWLTGDRATRTVAVAAALSGTLSLIVAGLLSSLFYMPRPFVEKLATNVLQHVADSSFPSDHVTVLAAATVALAFGRYMFLAVSLGFMTVAVGWARVALGLHFPSDVLAGLVIGSGIAWLFQAEILVRFAEFVEQIGELIVGSLSLDTLKKHLHFDPPQEP